MNGPGIGQAYQDAIQNFLGPILPLLEDESVTEVMVNAFDEIWVEVSGKVEKSDVQFPDEDALRTAAVNIAASVGRTLSEEEPRMDARLPNGYRVHAVLPPCARKGTTIAIRKFSAKQFKLVDYIRLKSLTADTAMFLDICMKLGKNILVSGGTGSGKTTFLGALCGLIPKGQRIIVIEDATELIIEYPHVVFFETRMASKDGLKEVSIRDLLKSSLRLRPDRIIVGEVRSSEALELVQAMNTGHKGCMGTVHANTASDAIIRLEALAQGGDAKISERALTQQIASAVDIVVQVSRFPDGSRRVAEIAEVRGFTADGAYDVRSIYAMSRKGQLQPTGELPVFIDEIEDNQIPFPRTKFEAA